MPEFPTLHHGDASVQMELRDGDTLHVSSTFTEEGMTMNSIHKESKMTSDEVKVTQLTVDAMRRPYQNAEKQMADMLLQFRQRGTDIVSQYSALAADVEQAIKTLDEALQRDVEAFHELTRSRTEELAAQVKEHMDLVAVASAEVIKHGKLIEKLNGGHGYPDSGGGGTIPPGATVVMTEQQAKKVAQFLKED